MSDYIERQAALDAIEVCLERDTKNACLDLCVDDPDLSRCMARYNGIKAVRKLVEERPAANAREDVQGCWMEYEKSVFFRFKKDGEPIFRDVTVYTCNKCGRGSAIKENFCPRCGARMFKNLF